MFTTTPRSSALAKEIAADATISVSLLRQVTITETSALPPTPPITPSSSSESSIEIPRSKLLKRVVKSAQPRMLRTARGLEDLAELPPPIIDKPLPRLPTQTAFSESCTLQNSMCIGFPKRPRHRCDSQSHPSLDAYASLPDGLHKGKIHLSKDMLPCIDWSGVSVKVRTSGPPVDTRLTNRDSQYYLEVSVLIGQDDLRARIPIRIF